MEIEMTKFEDEAMAEVTPPALARVTGSTGINPLQDSGARGVVWMVLNGILVFLVVEYDIVSIEGLAALETVVVGVSHVLGGLYDRFLRGRILSS